MVGNKRKIRALEARLPQATSELEQATGLDPKRLAEFANVPSHGTCKSILLSSIGRDITEEDVRTLLENTNVRAFGHALRANS